jgi:Gpi18-like mannosyltransferase
LVEKAACLKLIITIFTDIMAVANFGNTMGSTTQKVEISLLTVMAWCPFSLFGTVNYTEGHFLLLTTAALRAFDNRQHIRQHIWTAFFDAMATTIPPGLMLVPAFLILTWKERRLAIAYAADFTAEIGLFLFIVYCAICFGDP